MPRGTTSSTWRRTPGATADWGAPAWLARSVSRPQSRLDPAPRPADEAAAARGERIVCRRCGAELSDRSALFTIDAASAFVNPHGFLYQVMTVRSARNLLTAGPPTTDFTWYPGYAWEIAWCAACAGHVGWSFTATGGEREPPQFWALRRDAVREERS